MDDLEKMIAEDSVAPFAGAWIEMKLLVNMQLAAETSLPSRERGLKLKTVYHTLQKI